VYLHFESINAPDYFERRDLPCPSGSKMAHFGSTYRRAHVNMCLSMRSIYRAAGPSPDGAGAEIFFDVADIQALQALLREDPYVIGGIWKSWKVRQLVHLLVPLGPIPICLDGSRVVTALEWAVSDRHAAIEGLHELQRKGMLAVGAVTEEGTAIAWLHNRESVDLTRQHLKLSGELRTHSMVWVL